MHKKYSKYCQKYSVWVRTSSAEAPFWSFPRRGISFIQKSLLVITIFFCFTFPCFAQESFEEKSKLIIETIVNKYHPPDITIGDAEKYYYPITLARLSMYGQNDSTANDIIRFFEDKDPFHFTAIGLTRLLYMHRDNQIIKKNIDKYIDMVLKRADSDNLFNGEGTENHNCMSRTSGLLIAQLGLKRNFTNAKPKYEFAKKWLIEFGNRILQVGNGEWNSSIYYTYSIAGWLNVYDFVEDSELKNLAKKVLDQYAKNIALHHSWGLYGGPEMRGGGIGNFATSTNYLAILWFGKKSEFDLSSNREYIQLIHPILSKYRPPKEFYFIATKKQIRTTYSLNYPDYSLTKPSFVRETFTIDSLFTLGSITDDYGGFTGSTNQIISWKLIIKAHKNNEKPIEIGGNGRFHNDWNAKGRDPFTQIAQYHNVLFQLTKTSDNHLLIRKNISQIAEKWQKNWVQDFKARFPSNPEKSIIKLNQNVVAENKSYINLPKNTVVDTLEGCFTINYQNAYILLYPVSTKLKDSTINNRRMLISENKVGNLCGWVIEVVNPFEYKSYAEFQQKVKTKVKLTYSKNNEVIYTNLSGKLIKASYNDSGNFQEALVDWGFGVKKPIGYSFSTNTKKVVFKQPDWPSGKGYGRKIKLVIQ